MSDINVSASIDVGKNTQALIEKLAAQIGVTVDKVWPWLVQQQVLEGWTSLAATLLAVVIGIVLLGVGRRILLKTSEDLCVPFFVIGGVIFMIAAIAVFFHGPISVQQILNPEYAALKDLIGMVKP